MLDSKQQEWVAKVAKTLGVGKTAEDPKQRYEQSLKLLTPRFKPALGHDQGGELSGKIKSAMQLAQQGSYADAENILDDAGQHASQLVSAKMQPRQGQGGLVGKTLPGKYKNEQYQKDSSGNVIHGGEFRGDSKNRTKYYNDDERDKSIVRTDAEGRLVDRDGKFLPEHRGFVMSQDEGTLHAFDVNERETSPEGHTLHTHHSSAIQGGKAAAAGEMETEEGVLRKVTDQSGHYRPTPEMTHQMVQKLQNAGVAMRDKKLTMLDKDGNPQPATSEIQALLKEVLAFTKQYENDQSGPYDPQILKKYQKLVDLGVTESNREARVDLTNPKTFVTPEEFEKVKGNNKAIFSLVASKIGIKLTEEHVKFVTKTGLQSVEGINN